MSNTKTRLKRIEDRVGKLPMSPAERDDLEERLACRYTILTDIDRRIGHAVRGKDRGRYQPLRPSAEDLAAIREHKHVWDLPRASEKSADEAWAYLGDDTTERALADGKLWGGSWRIWIETEYVPTLQALQSQDRLRLFDVVFKRGLRGYREAEQRGEIPDRERRVPADG